jgi:hypothetical protein
MLLQKEKFAAAAISVYLYWQVRDYAMINRCDTTDKKRMKT